METKTEKPTDLQKKKVVFFRVFPSTEKKLKELQSELGLSAKDATLIYCINEMHRKIVGQN